MENECLTLKDGVQTFGVYLLGKTFTVQMDHKALQWFDKMKDYNN